MPRLDSSLTKSLLLLAKSNAFTKLDSEAVFLATSTIDLPSMGLGGMSTQLVMCSTPLPVKMSASVMRATRPWPSVMVITPLAMVMVMLKLLVVVLPDTVLVVVLATVVVLLPVVAVPLELELELELTLALLALPPSRLTDTLAPLVMPDCSMRPTIMLVFKMSRTSSLYSGLSKSAALLPGPIISSASLSNAALLGANKVLSPAAAICGISLSSLPSSTKSMAAFRADRSACSVTACAMLVGAWVGAAPVVGVALSPEPPPPQAAKSEAALSAAIQFKKIRRIVSSNGDCNGL